MLNLKVYFKVSGRFLILGDDILSTYSIKGISHLTGLSPSTLRYYDSDDEVEWVLFIKALRATNMPINDIKKYVKLFNEGNSTIQERTRFPFIV